MVNKIINKIIKRNKNTVFAFSLAEAIMSMLVIMIVTCCFAPMLTKQVASSGLNPVTTRGAFICYWDWNNSKKRYELNQVKYEEGQIIKDDSYVIEESKVFKGEPWCKLEASLKPARYYIIAAGGGGTKTAGQVITEYTSEMSKDIFIRPGRKAIAKFNGNENKNEQNEEILLNKIFNNNTIIKYDDGQELTVLGGLDDENYDKKPRIRLNDFYSKHVNSCEILYSSSDDICEKLNNNCKRREVKENGTEKKIPWKCSIDNENKDDKQNEITSIRIDSCVCKNLEGNETNENIIKFVKNTYNADNKITKIEEIIKIDKESDYAYEKSKDISTIKQLQEAKNKSKHIYKNGELTIHFGIRYRDDNHKIYYLSSDKTSEKNKESHMAEILTNLHALRQNPTIEEYIRHRKPGAKVDLKESERNDGTLHSNQNPGAVVILW